MVSIELKHTKFQRHLVPPLLYLHVGDLTASCILPASGISQIWMTLWDLSLEYRQTWT